MRKGHLLLSAAQGLFSLLVFLLGCFFLGLNYAPHLRLMLSAFFADPSLSFLGIGLWTSVCGLLLLFGFASLYRGRSYQVKMGRHRTEVDLALVEQLVSRFWQQRLPDEKLHVGVAYSRFKKLEIFLSLPSLSQKEQLVLLEQSETELQEQLRSQLGYDKPFTISVLLK